MRKLIFICISLVAGLVFCPPANAQSGLGRMMNPRLGQLHPKLQFDTGTACHEGVENQNTDLGFAWYDIDFQLPLRQDEYYESAVFGNVGAMDIATQARMENSGVALPDHLWNTELGIRTRWTLDNDFIAGLEYSVSSPSDKPFNHHDQIAINIMASVQIPAAQRNRHLLFINMSTNRGDYSYIPLPGYAYYWYRNPQQQLIFGLPFCWMHWEIIEKLNINASYLLPRNIDAEISYELFQDISVYTGFEWQNQAWLRAGRQEDDDQLYYYEKNVSLGLRWDLTENVAFNLEAGYAFDRFFFEGQDYDNRGDNRITIGDGLFAGLRVGVTF